MKISKVTEGYQIQWPRHEGVEQYNQQYPEHTWNTYQNFKTLEGARGALAEIHAREREGSSMIPYTIVKYKITITEEFEDAR